MADPTPIDYTARDFASVRQALLDRATTVIPEWTSRSPNDFGVLLIESMAYVSDVLNYYLDRAAGEAYLGTATQRASILNLAAELDYRPDFGQPATVTLTIGVVPGSSAIVVPAGSQFSSAATQSDVTALVVFETDVDLTIPTGVASGTVTATQGQTVTDEAVGTSTGMADQTFDLSQLSAVNVAVSVDEGSGPVSYTFIDHLIDAGPVDRVFTTTTDASNRTTILFGDGVNGIIPPNGAPVTATYRVIVGAAGNVGAGTINTLVSVPSQVSSVINTSGAVGGTDPESNDDIRRNAPKLFSTLHRAVTLDDYANIAYAVSGVAKAAAAGTSYANITVYVAPAGGGMPTTDLKQDVANYIDPRRMVNAVVTVTNPTYVPMDIVVGVQVLSQFSQSTVHAAVASALSSYLDFANTEFGQTLTVAKVYSIVMAVAGVDYVNVTTLAKHTVGSGVGNVSLAVNEIPTAAGGTQTVNVLGGGIP